MEKKDEEILKELKNYLQEKIFQLGMNTAHDYDGVETLEDVLIYTKAIIQELEDHRKIKRLYKW